MTFLRNVVVLAAGVVLAALIVPGISFAGRWDALLPVVLILAVFNAVLKPLLVLFTLPFIVLTLGLGLWIINALLLYWASRLVDGFQVAGFLAALAGAFIISVVNLFLSGGKVAVSRKKGHGPRHDRHDNDDVIDV